MTLLRQTAAVRVLSAATALACAALSIPAQAADINVSGRIDTYVEAHTTSSGSQGRLSSGGATPSFLLFSGEEDMGNGLKASFNLEMGFLPDNGMSTPDGSPTAGNYMFQRQANLGLCGSFGEVRFGYQYTPTFIALASTDPVGYSLGSAMGTFSAPGYAGVNGGAMDDFNARSENAISYTSPKLFGSTIVSLFVGLGETTKKNGEVSTTRGNYYGASVRFMQDALTVVGAASAAKAEHKVMPSGDVSPSTDYQLDFSVGYDFGVVKPVFTMAYKKGADDIKKGSDVLATQVGFSMPMGQGKWAASVGYLKNLTDSDGDAVAAGTRYDYSLSKRTFLYTGVAAVWNGDLANYGLTGGGGSSNFPTDKPGHSASTVFVGVNHKF